MSRNILLLVSMLKDNSDEFTIYNFMMFYRELVITKVTKFKFHYEYVPIPSQEGQHSFSLCIIVDSGQFNTGHTSFAQDTFPF